MCSVSCGCHADLQSPRICASFPRLCIHRFAFSLYFPRIRALRACVPACEQLYAVLRFAGSSRGNYRFSFDGDPRHYPPSQEYCASLGGNGVEGFLPLKEIRKKLKIFKKIFKKDLLFIKKNDMIVK